jgi:hypothetical protein
MKKKRTYIPDFEQAPPQSRLPVGILDFLSFLQAWLIVWVSNCALKSSYMQSWLLEARTYVFTSNGRRVLISSTTWAICEWVLVQYTSVIGGSLGAESLCFFMYAMQALRRHIVLPVPVGDSSRALYPFSVVWEPAKAVMTFSMYSIWQP